MCNVTNKLDSDLLKHCPDTKFATASFYILQHVLRESLNVQIILALKILSNVILLLMMLMIKKDVSQEVQILVVFLQQLLVSNFK